MVSLGNVPSAFLARLLDGVTRSCQRTGGGRWWSRSRVSSPAVGWHELLASESHDSVGYRLLVRTLAYLLLGAEFMNYV